MSVAGVSAAVLVNLQAGVVGNYAERSLPCVRYQSTSGELQCWVLRDSDVKGGLAVNGGGDAFSLVELS